MLSAIRRATSAQPTTKNVCIFCQRQPVTTASNLGLTRHFTSTVLSSAVKRVRRTSLNLKATKAFPRDASTVSKKAEPSAELIKEIRTEIEAIRQKKKSKEGEKKKSEPANKPQVKSKKSGSTVPKAPQVGRKSSTKPVGIPFSQIGQSLAQALRTDRTILTLNPSDVELTPIEVPNQPTVPSLSHDLDRVLFNPGVYFLQDPRSRVYNFNPYLQKLMPVHEFQFEALSQHITSSRDTRLESVAKKLGKKYVGSTSSMTSILSHFHYLLSNWRPINPAVISKHFITPWRTFTALQRGPQSIFLRWKDGVYAIDPDKEFDKESVLTLLGKSMEKLLTLPQEKFEKYRRSQNPVDLEQNRAVDTYHYSTLGDFLMRSQLDAYDPRLPGTGMFDLKTRAVVAVRMDVDNFHIGSGYQIKDRFGEWESFEREYFDMIRAAFLKYSLQVRMGRMDGIFVAFHNTERIFGFQYISLEEMDAAIHQDWHTGIGDREFKLSLQLLNNIFNKAAVKFPKRSLRIHFETRETQTPLMYIFAEPMKEGEIIKIQNVRNDDLSVMLKEFGNRKEQYLRSLSEKEAELEAKLEVKQKKFTEAEATPGGVTPTETAEDEEAPICITEGEAPDDAWAERMAKELDVSTNKEILAYTLKIKSFVNGKVVLRPGHLKPSDSWEVQYELEEIQGTRAWTTYRACYNRRAQLEKAHDDMTGGIITAEALNSNAKSNEFRNVYIQTIRNISKKGREYITELEKEQSEKIVWRGKA